MRIYRTVMALMFSLLSIFTIPALAETEFSFFGGIQESPHSSIRGTYSDGTSFRHTAGWEGKSFQLPPYYGLRITRWIDQRYGVALNFTHTKNYADKSTRDASGFTLLEFTDGLNPLTINFMFRGPEGTFRPYGGVGLGIAVPHVELYNPSKMTSRVYEYQYGGPVVSLLGGVRKPINQTWSWFAEYSFHYVMLDVEMGSNGTFKSNIINNAFNLGLNYSFK